MFPTTLFPIRLHIFVAITVETYTCFDFWAKERFSDFSAKFREMGATPGMGKIFGRNPQRVSKNYS